MSADPLADLLRRSPLTNSQRADVWDAYNAAPDQDALAATLESLNVPREVKANLWDLKLSTAAPRPLAPEVPEAVPEGPAPDSLAGRWAAAAPRRAAAVNALPAIGGTVGGIVGGAGGTVLGMGVGGAPGAIGGAAVGGAAGESLRQLIRRAQGEEAPATPTEAMRAIDQEGAIQGAAQAVGAGAGRVLTKAAPWLMQSAVKPTLALLKEYGITPPKLVKTLLDEGINVSTGGLARLQKLLGETNSEIAKKVANATGTIPKERVAAQVATTAQRIGRQTNPTKDLKAVGETVDEFLNHPIYRGDLTVAEAHLLKQGTYKQIGKKYGEQSSAEVEAQKALARGLKEEVADRVPGINALNAKDSEYMAAADAVGRQVALAGNKDPVGFAWVAQNPSTFIAALLDRQPVVKSMLANGMWKSASAVTGVSPALIRAAVIALASDEPGATPPPR